MGKRKTTHKRKTNRKQKKNTKRKPTGKNIFNTFFSKIFVINLYDHKKKWFKVRNQFNRRGIDVERFIVIDGRCKKDGYQACLEKARSFAMGYDVTIDPKQKNQNGEQMKPKEIVPVSSLSIGTMVLLRNQVKNKWPHMLICEDDIELTPQFVEKFKEGVRELKGKSYDLLYLGCGGCCGNAGLSYTKDKTHKHSSIYALPGIDYIDELYLNHPNDLRMICEGSNDCKPVSKNIVKLSGVHGGTWCYAWSLRGAKKMLKLMKKSNNLVSQHIDQIIKDFVFTGKLTGYSFNPVIAHHELISVKRVTDIPWKW